MVTHLSYYDISSYEDEVDDAADDWSDENIKPNFYETPSGPECDIEITDVDGKPWIAFTNLYPDYDEEYYFATIRCDTDDMDGFSHSKNQYVIAHELGHVLGLDHESGEGWVLMYPTTAAYNHGVRGPEDDDVDGVNAIYGEP